MRRDDVIEVEEEEADAPFTVRSWLGVVVCEEERAEPLSEEAAERVAFIFAEASDLAALGLRAVGECEADGRVSVAREVASLAETDRELEAS